MSEFQSWPGAENKIKAPTDADVTLSHFQNFEPDNLAM